MNLKKFNQSIKQKARITFCRSIESFTFIDKITTTTSIFISNFNKLNYNFASKNKQ